MSSRPEVTLAIAHARAWFQSGDIAAAHRAVEAALARCYEPGLALTAGRLAALLGDEPRARELLWRASSDAAIAAQALVSLAPLIEPGEARRLLSLAHDLEPGVVGRWRDALDYAMGLAAYRGRMWRRALSHFAPLVHTHRAASTAAASCAAALVDDAVASRRALEAVTIVLQYATHLPGHSATAVGLRLAALLSRSGEAGAARWFLRALADSGVTQPELHLAAALAGGRTSDAALADLAALPSLAPQQRLAIMTARAARCALAGDLTAAQLLVAAADPQTPAALLRELCAVRRAGGSLHADERRPEWREFAAAQKEWSPAPSISPGAELSHLPAEPRAAALLLRGERTAADRVLHELLRERPDDLRLVHNRALLALARAESARGAEAVSAWNECIAQLGIVLGDPRYLLDWVAQRLAVYAHPDEDAAERAAALAADIESGVRDRLLRCRDRAQSEGGRADYGRFDILLVDFHRELIAARALRERALPFCGMQLHAGPLAVARLGLSSLLTQHLRRLGDGDARVCELRAAFSWLGRPLARAALGMHIDAADDLRRLARAAAQMDVAPPGFGSENPGYGGSPAGWARYLLDLRAQLIEQLLAAFRTRLTHAVAPTEAGTSIAAAVQELFDAAHEHGFPQDVLPAADALFVSFAEQLGQRGELADLDRVIAALALAHKAELGERVRGSLASWHNRRALLRHEAGELASAVQDLSEALALNPHSPTIVGNLVEVLLQSARASLDGWEFAAARTQAGRSKEVVAEARARSSTDEKLVRLEAEVAQLLAQIDDEEQQAGADEPGPVLGRALTLFHKRRFAPAVLLLEAAAVRHPDDARTADYLAWACTMQADELIPHDRHAARGMHERATAVVRAALARWPEYQPLHKTRARLQVQHAALDAAASANPRSAMEAP